jgi:DNA helicase-2/ATP-dependent DNA helicase PcrA
LRGFSATSINNYLRNPWDYFYRNILRVPQVQPTHMQFGTAIHNTLEKITRQHTKDKKLPNENQILAWYEHELSTLPVSKNEYDRLREQGAETLLTYLNHLEKTLPAITYEELNIKVVLKTGLAALPEIMLTGKLDRLDMALDGTALQVVDYKTGKPKTRNAIEGKNAGGDGGYKRQLVFYALLLSLYEHEQFITKTGVLSFVQADSKGCIKEECFSITNEEIEGLKKDIIAAVADITTGAFLSDELAASESEYAHLIPWLRR